MDSAARHLGRFVAALATTAVFAGSALAAGVVQTLHGDVRAAQRPVSVNQRLLPGTTVTTGSGAQAVILFDDGAQVVLHQNTEFRIVDFRYNDADATTDRSILDLVKGALRMVSGTIGRRSRPAFALRTPQVTIGIRGTDFMVAVVNPTYVQVIQGAVGASNTAGTVVFGAGATGVATTSATLAAPIVAGALPPAASSAFNALGAVKLGYGASYGVAGGVATGAPDAATGFTPATPSTWAGIAAGAAAAAALAVSGGHKGSTSHAP